jgi:2-dehydropantoate 2-reductase
MRMTIEDDKPMNVAVLGPGGVGGLLAALLSRRGDRVVCIARPSTCERLLADGISVRSKRFGDFKASVEAASELRSPVDVCFVAVKATELGSALDRVSRDALGNALIVPFLNGVEHVAALREKYGEAVVPATIRVEATRVSPGLIEQASPFAFIELALAGGADAARGQNIRSLAHHLVAAGLDVEIRSDEALMLWGKLGFLAPLALLTTHEKTSAGQVRTKHRSSLLSVVHEVAEVARRAGAPIDEQATLKLFDSVPASMQSSMQKDAAAGRTTEIEAIGGAILRAAKRHGVEVPLTSKLVANIRSRQPKAAKDGSEERAY